MSQQLLSRIPEFFKFWITTISELLHLECSKLVWMLISMIPNVCNFHANRWRLRWCGMIWLWILSVGTLDISSSRSHVHFLLLRLFNRISLSLEPCVTFHNMLFLQWGVSLPPNPEVENHPLSTVSDCLFNIFAATLHIYRPHLHHNVRKCHTMVTKYPLDIECLLFQKQTLGYIV
jgi:hypothetical protein